MGCFFENCSEIQFSLWRNHSWFSESVGCWFKNCSDQFSSVSEQIFIVAFSQWVLILELLWGNQSDLYKKIMVRSLIRDLHWVIQSYFLINYSRLNESVGFWSGNCFKRFSLICEWIIIGLRTLLVDHFRSSMSDSVCFVNKSFLVHCVSGLFCEPFQPIQDLTWTVLSWIRITSILKSIVSLVCVFYNVCPLGAKPRILASLAPFWAPGMLVFTLAVTTKTNTKGKSCYSGCDDTALGAGATFGAHSGCY